MPEFIYGEAEAAEFAGLPLKKFAAARVRFLKQGVDWDVPGLHVAYCSAGLLSVLEKVTGKTGEEILLKFVQKISAPPAIEQAEVTRIYPNPHLLQARLLANGGGLVLVRCKTTKNFRVGMELPIRKAGPDGLIWELARRLPRYGGRW